MKTIIDINQITFKPANEFANELGVNNGQLAEFTYPGEMEKQIISSIYYTDNDFFQFLTPIEYHGIICTITFSKDYIYFCYELFDNPLVKYYNNQQNIFGYFLKLKREDLLDFEKLGNKTFKAFNTSSTLNFLTNMNGVPGGMVTSLVFSAARKIGSKIESKTLEKEGKEYILKFKTQEGEKAINLIVENYYVPPFDKILEAHWKREASFNSMKEQDGGCFIATMCYGSYDHEKVLVLREFRDKVLLKTYCGKLFVKLYYTVSPFLVKYLGRSKKIKAIIRSLFIEPIVKLIKDK